MKKLNQTIPSGWKETTLGEVAQVKGRIGWRGYTVEDLKDSGPMVIGGTQITNNELDFSKPVFISEEKYEESPEIKIKLHDIILTKTGNSIGDIAIVNKDIGKATINPNVALIRTDKCDPYYLYYLLLTREAQFYIKSGSTASAQPAINQDTIKKYVFYCPGKPEQRSIAAVLSSLDDKIELLRAQNKTLENIAQSLFKRWFVDFEFPDEKGKPYKSGGGKMVDSELGKIPEGWRVGKLGKEFDITIGRTPPREENEWFSNTPIGKKWISIKDIGNSEMYISKTSEYLTDEAVEKFNIPIIPENTTIMSFKMTVGKLAITTEKMLSNEAIAHLKIKENSNLSTEFIYSFLKGLDFNSLGSTSSIVMAINSTMIKEIEILIPEKGVMQNYNEAIQPIFAKLQNNNFQIQTLSHLRDTILPKLMRGEIRAI